MKNKVWLITGASKGMGLEIAVYLLKNGFQVAATSRNKKALIDAVGDTSGNFLPLEMNVTDEEAVKAALKTVKDTFGDIDVIVNNAGYGLLGYLEEVSDEEARNCYDVNVFGTLNVIRNVLPYLREKDSGYIFNFSSVAGAIGFAGSSIYSGTKFAVDGISDSLNREMKLLGWNIKVTSVKFGYFRTEFLGESMVLPKGTIEAYDEHRSAYYKALADTNHKQLGNPEKIAPILIALTEAENPPANLFLGSDAYKFADRRKNQLQKEMDQWKELAFSTDFKE